MGASDPIALILAGGSGTRFWPSSRKDFPKQYLSLFGPRSLIQGTVDRVQKIIPSERIFICSTMDQEPLVKKQLPEISHLILEPQGRNTAVCLMLSVLHLEREGISSDTPMAVLPADHFIKDETRFLNVLQFGFDYARTSRGLITLGIIPESAHTGYGYIEASPGEAVRKVRRFIEKPDKATAEIFLKDPNFYWNSGMFLWTLGTLREAFVRWMPETFNPLAQCASDKDLETFYASVPSVSIDVGVMEKATNGYVIPAALGWSDVGSWDALYRLRATKPGENVCLSGKLKTENSSGCLVKVSPDRSIALVGAHHLVIVEEGNRILVTDRNQDQKVRAVARAFEDET
jgi:mannose-1-phosphate guanylyltransferase